MRTFSIAKRVIKQIIGDKRSLGLLFFAPVFVFFLLNIILNSAVTKPKLEAYKLPPSLIATLKSQSSIKEINDPKAAYIRLKDKKIDGLLVLDNNILTVNVEGSETSITGAVKKSVSLAFSEYTKASLAGNPGLSRMGIKMLENKFVFINGSENMSTFDTIAPMMMGFFIFFFVFLIAGIAFLRERISGTLDRLLATPIKRLEIVLG